MSFIECTHSEERGSRTVFYRQCELRKDGRIQTSWIHEDFAEVGTIVGLKERDEKTWEGDWVVERVWGKIDEHRLLKYRRDAHKTQREASDI